MRKLRGVVLSLVFTCASAACAQDAGAPKAAGPALREALAQLEADPAGAREKLAAVARDHPIVADHALHQIVASYAKQGDAAHAAESAAAFLVSWGDSPLAGRVAALEGEAAVALGDEPRARKAFALAGEEARSREERAGFALESARSLIRSGELAPAARALIEIWRDDAPTQAASAARTALDALHEGAAKAELPMITGEDSAQRCRALFDAYWNDAARAACEESLASGALSAQQSERIAALRAELLFRDRRYVDAERAFAALPDSHENRYWRARALARSGRIDEAKAAFEALGRERDGWGARALFLLGTLYEDDDVKAASARYRKALALAQTPELRIEARWRLAWRAVLERRWRDAAADLGALASDTADPVEALRARYWEARALAAADDPSGAAKLATLARDWAFTYYGQQAAKRAGDAQPEPAAASDAPPLTSGPSPTSGPSLESGPPLAESALQRLRILLEASLIDDAGSEARALAPRARQRSDRLALAALLQDAGQFDAAQRLILDAYGVTLAAGPGEGEPDLWWAAYPQAFAADVDASAQRHGIAPELLFAVMREESSFRPNALSVVGARGLVQIMPETGRRLAQRLGAQNFSPDELFVPARSLELGAAYLAELLARFDGSVSSAVASYNAGPEAVERWRAQNGQLDEDAWIEAIPYDQTRSYAKRVLRSYAIYQALY